MNVVSPRADKGGLKPYHEPRRFEEILELAVEGSSKRTQ